MELRGSEVVRCVCLIDSSVTLQTVLSVDSGIVAESCHFLLLTRSKAPGGDYIDYFY